MTLMIVGLDQLLWRPVVVWAQKFRIEEGGAAEAMSSWFRDLLRRSHILTAAGMGIGWLERRAVALRPAASRPAEAASPRSALWLARLSLAMFCVLLVALVYGGIRLLGLLSDVSLAQWADTLADALLTLVRVLVAVALGTLWALPAGLAIGLSPRLSRVLQPVVQVVASFPAPMLFPIVIAILAAAGVSLDFGSVVLMLLGTQWYILFNVIAGAMAVPSDLREMARSYRIRGWQRFRDLYFPAVFPYLVTGWVTAAGGAWNASIVAEYVTFRSDVLRARGLGDQISYAAQQADFPLLAASILVMSLVVVVFNRTVWRRCYRVAEERFSLNK
jgi:NitT/TauT family transport system permease protein